MNQVLSKEDMKPVDERHYIGSFVGRAWGGSSKSGTGYRLRAKRIYLLFSKEGEYFCDVTRGEATLTFREDQMTFLQNIDVPEEVWKFIISEKVVREL